MVRRYRNRVDHRITAVCIAATMLLHAMVYRWVERPAAVTATRRDTQVIALSLSPVQPALEPAPPPSLARWAPALPEPFDFDPIVATPDSPLPSITPTAAAVMPHIEHDTRYSPEDFVPGADLSRLPLPSGELPCPVAADLRSGPWRVLLTVFVNDAGRVPRIDIDDPTLPHDLIAAIQNAIADATFAPGQRFGRAVKAAVRFEATVMGGRLQLTPAAQ